jgi:hypothetical protein
MKDPLLIGILLHFNTTISLLQDLVSSLSEKVDGFTEESSLVAPPGTLSC